MANLNVRVDDTVKNEADALFASLGMNTTTAVNIFLRKAVQYGGIPFEIKNPSPNSQTIKAMANVEDGINLSPVFKDTKSLMEDLNA
ncbi:MAG: type II toxin-antitoxin system RelB/DinJ family antitoxin [Oscillospiraceae bacterium]